VLLVVLEKAKQKYSFRLYGVCLMANHIHLLIKPQDATQLPKLMHWVGWYMPQWHSTAYQGVAGTTTGVTAGFAKAGEWQERRGIEGGYNKT
jgi:REP element-mobilizing transposase RayT